MMNKIRLITTLERICLKAVNAITFMLLLGMSLMTLSCREAVELEAKDAYAIPAIPTSLAPVSMTEDVEELIELPYTKTSSGNADSCAILSSPNLIVSTPCACDLSGVCTVGMTGNSNYFGATNLEYSITASAKTAQGELDIIVNPVDDAPVAIPSSSSVNEDTETFITLGYTDIESDLGASCNISNLINAHVSTACSCDLAGNCSVGVTGDADYFGAASFDFEVVTNGLSSNTETHALTIGNVDDAPVGVASSGAAAEETPVTVALGYFDVEGDLASSCSLSNLNHVSESIPCACDGMGQCSVEVVGDSNFFGSASFDFSVTANGQASVPATHSLNISNVDDAPVAFDGASSANEDTQEIISLSYFDVEGDLGVSCAISNLSNITITSACFCDGVGICSVGVTGVSNYNGSASFDFSVTANGQTTNIATQTLTINNVDDAPVAIDDSSTSTEDVENIISLGYTDADSDLALSCSVNNLNNVFVSTACVCDGAGACSVGITGNSDFNGAASFDFTVTANGQTSNTATHSLTINNVDDAPVAVDDSSSSTEDIESIITLGYSDVDSDLAVSCAVSNFNNVSVSTACVCDGAGACSVGITGASDYVGAASFDFTVTANGQTSNTGTHSLTINNVDDAPVAIDDSSTSTEDVENIILLGYTDADSDLALSCSVNNLNNVFVSTACVCDGAGACSVGITGNSDFNGAASFDFTVTANGQTSNTATHSLTINNVDDAPVAVDDSSSSTEDIESIITLGYSDVDSDLAVSCAVSNLNNISVSTACLCDGAGLCTVGVTGLADYNGAAGFDFTVTANGQISNTATHSLTINNVDDAPVANDDSSSASEDIESVIALGYTDADSDLAVSCSISNLSNITVSTACACDGSGACSVGVTGAPDYVGAASFDFTVTANGQTSNVATHTLTINNVDDAPVAIDDSSSATEDVESMVILGYTDADSDLATVCSLSNLSNVTVSTACACDGAGVCSVGVTGLADFNGAAGFDFTVTANGQTSNTATHTLTINNVDDAPVANDDSSSGTEDLESIISLGYTDADSDLAVSCLVSNLSNVTISTACSCDGAGSCSVGITGTADYVGAASFDFTVTANGQTSNAATHSLVINNQDDAPIAIDNSSSATEDVESVIVLGYTDADSDLAVSCQVNNLNNVFVSTACSCDGAGTCSAGITGSSDYVGAGSFDFTVTANGQTSNTATHTLTINNVDDAPVALNNSSSATEDVESVITLGYTDADSDLAVSCSISNLSNISVSTACACDGAGLCSVGITGASDYVGAASFDFTVTANGQTSNTATHSLTINNVDDAPVAIDDSSSATEDVESVISLGYTDADSDLALTCAISNLNNVSVSTACSCDGAGACSVGITGAGDYVGAASFGFTVTANGQISNVATHTLTISNVDDAPIAIDNSSSATEDIESIVTLGYTDADSDLAVSCSLSNLSNVSVSTACACDGAGLCSVGVTGLADFNGAASFDFSVTANGQTSNVATHSLTINNVDDAPVANNDSSSATEDVESIVTLGYTDADSDLAVSCALSNLSNVSVSTACACDGAGACTVGVTGLADYIGPASFDFSVTANGQTSNVATHSLTINNQDDAPVANDDSSSATEDVESVIALGYTDADSDLALSCSISNLSNVSVSTACACDGAGVCTVGITGTADYVGSAAFDFTVTANGQTSNTATHTLTINNVDDAPIAIDNSSNATEDVESIISLGYTDADSDLAASCSISNLSNVSISTACACDGGGACTVGITGSADFVGAGSFDFTVTANGQTSNIATHSLTVNNVDDAPIANDDSSSATEDVESIVSLGYTDADADLAISCSVSNLSNVTVSTACSCDGAGACSVGITGASDYIGPASFDFTVTANGQSSNVATHTLSINNVDDAPVALADASAGTEDLESIITLGYTDADSDLAASCAISNLNSASVTTACACDGAGVCTVGVTGASDFYGAASFDFTVTANGQTSNVATHTFNVSNVDDAPLAIDDSSSATEDLESTITLGYTDADSDLAFSCSISNLSNVTVSTVCACDGGGNCSVGVTGTTDYVGAASFDFTVTANGQTSNVATHSLTINNQNDPPAAANDSSSMTEDLESVITLGYTDADSDLADSCALSNLANVTISTACACDGAGLCSVGVTGLSDYNGGASFDFTVTANGQTSNTATHTLTINNVDDAPVANDGASSGTEDVENTISLGYTDVDSDLAVSCTLSNLNNVSISTACSCDGAGSCSAGVTGLADFNGIATFDFTVTANGQTSNVATHTLTINNVDDAPVASDDSSSATEDLESIISLGYVDVDSDLALSCSVSNLNNVSVTTVCSCDGAGACLVGVTGGPDYVGAASFDFTVTANGQISNTATHTLTINNQDDAPVASDDSSSGTEDIESIITLGYSDADADLATTCAISNLSNVSVSTACSCDGAGVCTVGVTGLSDFAGAASFDFTVNANGQTSNVATHSITVNNVDDAPVVANDSSSTTEDVEAIISLGYSDADADLAISCSLSNLSNVTVSTACSCDGAGVCSVGVTGTSDYVGAASFDFTVTANGQTSNTATHSLTINNVDDAPIAVNDSSSATEDVESVITLGYSDSESDLATTCSLSNLANIAVSTACSCDGGGICTVGVTGNTDFAGAASFDFTVTANGQSSNTATHSLSITNVDDAPVASNGSASATEEVEAILTLAYTDADSDLGTSCSLSNLSNVTITTACSCDGAGICTVGVTGISDFNGSAGFDFTVTANGAVSNTASFTVNISNVDDAPVALNNSSSATEDIETIVTLGYTDADSDLAGACALSNLSNVTISTACSCDGAGVCTVGVTGSTDFNGAASFDFTVTANGQSSNVATHTLTINNVDDAPVANNNSSSATEDVESIVTLGYSDADSDLAVSCSLSNLTNLSVSTPCSCDGAGVCSVGVTGDSDFVGAASFDFTVSANGQTSNTATHTLTINNVDDAPVALDNSSSESEDAQAIISLGYLDAEGDLGTSCSISNLNNVSVTTACSCDGLGICSVGVTPSADYTGSASFDFTITANGQTSNTATHSLTINNVDDAPVAIDDSSSATEDVESVISLGYTDVDGDLATSCSLSGLNNVSVTTACSCDGAGSCSVGVTGTADFFGAGGFDFTITANGQTSNTGSHVLTINNVDDAPVANDNTLAGAEDSEVIITLGYTDQESDLATACSISSLANVSISTACGCDGAGGCTVGITGDADFYGTASFDFTVTANGQSSNVAEITLNISNVDDAPVAADDSDTLSEDTETILTLGYSDVEGDLATSCSASNLSNVFISTACSCDGVGVCSVGITGDSNYFGAASFDFTVTANGLSSTTGSFSLSISNVEDSPIANNFTPDDGRKNNESIIVLDYNDPDGDLANLCSVSNLSSLTVTTACACDGAGVCSVGVTPPLNYMGAASFDFDVTANGLTSNTSTASFTIGENPMVMQWRVGDLSYGDGDNSITLPLRSGFTYNFVVDWGDGNSDTITFYNDAATTHIYAVAGDYTVTLTGTVQAFYFNGAGDKDKLLSVEELGDVGWTNLNGAFKGCSNLTEVSNGAVSSVTDMASMFEDAPQVVVNSKWWTTSSVTNMSYMFAGAAAANPDTSGWNTANVSNMEGMFQDAVSANPNTSSWNTASVTNMSYMFDGASQANPSTTSWNTGLVINMAYMFRDAPLANPSVGSWDVSKVTDMTEMFKNASAADPDVSAWNTGKVSYMGGMFMNAVSVDPDFSGWNLKFVQDMSDMFTGLTLPTATYNTFLQRTDATTIRNNVTLDGGGSLYSAGAPASARSSLISSGWTINDGGQE